MLLVLSLAVITIDFRSHGTGPLAKVSHAVESVLGPVQNAIAKVVRPIGNFFSGFGQAGSLKSRIRHLEEQLAVLQQDSNYVNQLLRENDLFRKMLELKRKLGYQTQAAQVFGHDPSNFEQALLIEGGTRDGFRKDMAVVGIDGLVGRIVAVSPSTSTVELISNRDSSVAVRLASGKVGTLDGTGGPDLRLQILDPNATLTAQDEVDTSGESSIYPPGIKVGTVTRVEPPGGNTTRRAFVQPAVDFSSLDFVLVVVDPTAPNRPDPTPEPTPAATASPSVSAATTPPATPKPTPKAKPTATAHPSPGASR